jgi:hypothetical protein
VRVAQTGSGLSFEQRCFFERRAKESTRGHFPSLHLIRFDLQTIWKSLRFLFA